MRNSLLISLAIGAPWLWVANQSAIAATVLIIAMAIAAIFALFSAPKDDKWFARFPVAIYAGWLTAASCVSIATTFAGYGLIMDETGWAYCGIGLALAIALSVQAKLRETPPYGLTVVWALVGIVVANGMSSGVGLLACFGIGVLLVALGRQFHTNL